MTNSINHQFDLTGKVALITGASRGIGAAVAQAYAAAGAKVVLSSRKQAALDEVAATIQAAGGDALAVAAHTGDSAGVQALVERAAAVYGGVDILVNNAATNPHFGPLLSSDESHWDKILDVNVKGYFRLAQACVPSMQSRGGGKIINMASIAGKAPLPNMGIYSISKAAVLMLTEVLAVELAAANIQVNAIAPGFVKTAFSRAIWDNPAIHDAVVQRIPQRRIANVEELTGIALYLAAPPPASPPEAPFSSMAANSLTINAFVEIHAFVKLAHKDRLVQRDPDAFCFAHQLRPVSSRRKQDKFTAAKSSIFTRFTDAPLAFLGELRGFA
ncbi:MAG: glucose 1-dehydrogenase [Caldilineaceae bacterium]